MQKLTLPVLMFGALITSPLHAATGVFGSFIQVNDGNTAEWFDLGSSTILTDFNNTDLGVFDLLSGDTLTITNAEVLTFKNNGGDVTGAQLNWRVYKTSDTPSSFNQIAMNFGANAPNTDAAGFSFNGGGDQSWGNLGGIASQPNVLTGLTNGDYLLETFIQVFSNEGDRFANAGGANYTASFTVVPEPMTASLALLGLGALAGVRIRPADDAS